MKFYNRVSWFTKNAFNAHHILSCFQILALCNSYFKPVSVGSYSSAPEELTRQKNKPTSSMVYSVRTTYIIHVQCTMYNVYTYTI